jgi:hypothetical protein
MRTVSERSSPVTGAKSRPIPDARVEVQPDADPLRRHHVQDLEEREVERDGHQVLAAIAVEVHELLGADALLVDREAEPRDVQRLVGLWLDDEVPVDVVEPILELRLLGLLQIALPAVDLGDEDGLGEPVPRQIAEVVQLGAGVGVSAPAAGVVPVGRGAGRGVLLFGRDVDGIEIIERTVLLVGGLRRSRGGAVGGAGLVEGWVRWGVRSWGAPSWTLPASWLFLRAAQRPPGRRRRGSSPRTGRRRGRSRWFAGGRTGRPPTPRRTSTPERLPALPSCLTSRSGVPSASRSPMAGRG